MTISTEKFNDRPPIVSDRPFANFLFFFQPASSPFLTCVGVSLRAPRCLAKIERITVRREHVDVCVRGETDRKNFRQNSLIRATPAIEGWREIALLHGVISISHVVIERQSRSRTYLSQRAMNRVNAGLPSSLCSSDRARVASLLRRRIQRPAIWSRGWHYPEPASAPPYRRLVIAAVRGEL